MSGQRRVESRERTLEAFEWIAESGKVRAESRNGRVQTGERKAECEEWKVESGDLKTLR